MWWIDTLHFYCSCGLMQAMPCVCVCVCSTASWALSLWLHFHLQASGPCRGTFHRGLRTPNHRSSRRDLAAPPPDSSKDPRSAPHRRAGERGVSYWRTHACHGLSSPLIQPRFLQHLGYHLHAPDTDRKRQGKSRGAVDHKESETAGQHQTEEVWERSFQGQ